MSYARLPADGSLLQLQRIETTGFLVLSRFPVHPSFVASVRRTTRERWLLTLPLAISCARLNEDAMPDLMILLPV